MSPARRSSKQKIVKEREKKPKRLFSVKQVELRMMNWSLVRSCDEIRSRCNQGCIQLAAFYSLRIRFLAPNDNNETGRKIFLNLFRPNLIQTLFLFMMVISSLEGLFALASDG